jgi:hypothetical protein
LLIACCQRSSSFHPWGLSYFSGFLMTNQVRNSTLQINLCCRGSYIFTQQVDQAKYGTLLSLTIPWVPHPLRPTKPAKPSGMKADAKVGSKRVD